MRRTVNPGDAVDTSATEHAHPSPGNALRERFGKRAGSAFASSYNVMAGALLACVILAGGPQQTTSTPQQPTAVSASAQEPSTSTDLPVSLERIERALAAPPPAIDFKEQHPVFRVEVYGRKPTLEDLLGEKFWIGPAPYAGMTHEEFMTMSTPREMQPYAGFTGKYLVAETALTLAEQWALKSALHKFKDAKTNHEREAARKEVLDALAELEKARKAAGLER